MEEFEKIEIRNHKKSKYNSSSFVFDLRNSTKIIRIISWNKERHLEKHMNFMMDLHEYMYKKIYSNCNHSEFEMNDTGDGYICIFWDSSHSLTCLKIALYVKDFLEEKLNKNNESLNLPIKLGYGIGFHSGSSIIYRCTYTNKDSVLKKDFLFGIVANTASRTESFTKNYIDHNVLVTGNFKDAFISQTADTASLKSLFDDDSTDILPLGRANINDGKENDNVHGNPGHSIYALMPTFFSKFKLEYMQNH